MKNIEKITWRDIHAIPTQWLTIQDSIGKAKKMFNQEHLTVGFVVYEDENMVVISATFDGVDLYNDSSMIPKGVIIKREEIESN